MVRYMDLPEVCAVWYSFLGFVFLGLGGYRWRREGLYSIVCGLYWGYGGGLYTPLIQRICPRALGQHVYTSRPTG